MPTCFVPIKPTTLDAAIKLMNRLYTEAGGEHDAERARRAIGHLFSHPDAGGVWFIECDSHTAGYIAITACFSLEFGGAFGLLDELYLIPERRGHGLGAQAIAFAELWCRSHGCEALRLEVELSNERALRLYRQGGFISHHRDLMTKWL